jgi:hypothetical protein
MMKVLRLKGSLKWSVISDLDLLLSDAQYPTDHSWDSHVRFRWTQRIVSPQRVQEYRQQIIDYLRGMGLKQLKGTYSSEFSQMVNADTLAIGDSTTAWWAAFLNDMATEVYTPSRWRPYKKTYKDLFDMASIKWIAI